MKEKSPQEEVAANRQTDLITSALENARNADGYWLNPVGKLAPKVYERGPSVSPFNALILALHSDAGGYDTNLYTTFPNARKRGDAILKGERGVPFLYYRWDTYVNKHNPEDKVSKEEYQAMTAEQQALYKGLRQREVRTLFNLSQTTMPMADAEGYRKILDSNGNRNERGRLDKEESNVRMSVNNFILHVRDNLVPIRKSTTGEATYDINKDAVYMPAQSTFGSYPEYVQELMRKVVEATGHGERLARETAMNAPKTAEARDRYEMLVQELASGIKMTELGLPAKLKPETMALADFWAKEFKENPCLIDRLEADVNNALDVMRRAERGEKIEFASKRLANQVEELRGVAKPQVTHEEALVIQDILRHGGMSIDARNFPGATPEEKNEAKKAFMEKFCNLDYYEGQLCLALYQAQEKLTDPELINTAYTAASNEAARIHRVMSEYLPREHEQKGSHFIADEMMCVPDAKSREFVVVFDKATGIADVVLPDNARTGGDVVMPNGDRRNFWLTPDEVMLPAERKEAGAKVVTHNTTGLNKDKIEAALMAQGASYVRFFNKEGFLRYRPDDEYFRDKEVYAAKLNGKEISQETRFDVTDTVRRATEQQFDRISMIKDDDGRYALLLKPEGQDSYAIYPDKDDTNRFFATIKTGDTEAATAIRNELAQKYHAMAINHPELKTDLFYNGAAEGVNPDLNYKVCIFKTRDEKIMISLNMGDGQRIPPRELTNQQWQRLWVADNVAQYKNNLAALVYADILKKEQQEEQKQQQEEQKKEENQNDDRKDVVANAVVTAHIIQQFEKMKEKHPDAVLLFRHGDEYTSFREDADKLKEILGTKINKEQFDGKTERYSSFPHSELDERLPKLIRAGERVAICEEMTDQRSQDHRVERGHTEDEATHRAQ